MSGVRRRGQIWTLFTWLSRPDPPHIVANFRAGARYWLFARQCSSRAQSGVQRPLSSLAMFSARSASCRASTRFEALSASSARLMESLALSVVRLAIVAQPLGIHAVEQRPWRAPMDRRGSGASAFGTVWPRRPVRSGATGAGGGAGPDPVPARRLGLRLWPASRRGRGCGAAGGAPAVVVAVGVLRQAASAAPRGGTGSITRGGTAGTSSGTSSDRRLRLRARRSAASRQQQHGRSRSHDA